MIFVSIYMFSSVSSPVLCKEHILVNYQYNNKMTHLRFLDGQLCRTVLKTLWNDHATFDARIILHNSCFSCFTNVKLSLKN